MKMFSDIHCLLYYIILKRIVYSETIRQILPTPIENLIKVYAILLYLLAAITSPRSLALDAYKRNPIRFNGEVCR